MKTTLMTAALALLMTSGAANALFHLLRCRQRV
jgi:hypothetical protein